MVRFIRMARAAGFIDGAPYRERQMLFTFDLSRLRHFVAFGQMSWGTVTFFRFPIVVFVQIYHLPVAPSPFDWPPPFGSSDLSLEIVYGVAST